MFGFVSRYLHRRRIRRTARRVGARLRRDYGARGPYTQGQVETAAQRVGVPNAYLIYAYVLFMEQDAFAATAPELGALDAEALRQEAADTCFNGDAGFEPSDAIAYGGTGASSGWGDSGGYGAHGDPGGFGGGGGGGDGGGGGM